MRDKSFDLLSGSIHFLIQTLDFGMVSIQKVELSWGSDCLGCTIEGWPSVPSATLLCTLTDMGEWFSFAMLFAHDEPHTSEMWGLPVNLNLSK